jgi:hypothetical protein
MPMSYTVEYRDEKGNRKKRTFTSADSRQTFINTVKSRGGRIDATTQQEETTRSEGFSLFR